MTGRERLLKYAQNRKIFRGSDVEHDLGLSRMYISRLVKEGHLERVGYGLYSLAAAEFNENQSILEVVAKVPKGVLCLLSALRFHDLTTQNPFEIWIAIERDMWIPKMDAVRLRVFGFSPKVYEAGIETHTIDGVEVKVYSPAKTIADCFYYQKTVGLDVCIEALRDAWNSRKVTMDELFHFAKIRNVKGTILPYLNTLS
ncbi:MAG TPA: type IV toxin-antitoxin system AbiEi family antitoxin domain-containing protein [Pyrinomonadaceae bacterium]|nr:type IV toxin-antitoxin system AbiEi family antitoxin domain-containing protein [Pyrinomonadaceae bacterium]